MKSVFRKNICRNCKSNCCRYVTIELGVPEGRRDFEKARWFLVHENVEIVVEQDGSWWLKLITPCEKLDENDLCDIYDKRPLPCREFSSKYCSVNCSENESLIVFSSVEELDDYMKKVIEDEDEFLD